MTETPNGKPNSQQSLVSPLLWMGDGCLLMGPEKDFYSWSKLAWDNEVLASLIARLDLYDSSLSLPPPFAREDIEQDPLEWILIKCLGLSMVSLSSEDEMPHTQIAAGPTRVACTIMGASCSQFIQLTQ